jgi:hypothetical protein
MNSNKRDWLTTCNEFNVPSQDFEAQFCARCFQHECSRSLHGKSKFEERVSTWEERLFLNVPKMDEGDPRAADIQAKKFVSVDAGPVPEVGRSAWLDPRDLTDEVPELPPEVAPVAPEVPKVDDPQPKPQIFKEGPTPMTPARMNTPNRPGQMIGGREKPQKPAMVDPWQPKRSPETQEGETVVQPGARIRFGRS